MALLLPPVREIIAAPGRPPMPHAVDHNAILDRLAAMLGGTRNVFDALDPARTAHLIVDMQNGFMEPGAPVEVPMAREIVDEVNRLSAAVRAAGGRNYFLRYTTPLGDVPAWPAMWKRLGPEGAKVHQDAFTPGAHHWQMWPEIEIAEGDTVIDKHRFSAFTPGTCTLHEQLQAAGIDTVIISGTLTNCCCESTARDAMQNNYRVIMAADAMAALSDEEHAATLHILGMVFADLRSVEELEARLAVSAKAQAA
jgi:ureidoacrylate peracid hydrolase